MDTDTVSFFASRGFGYDTKIHLCDADLQRGVDNGELALFTHS